MNSDMPPTNDFINALSYSNIFLGIKVDTKSALLSWFSERASTTVNVSRSDIFSALSNRESLGSTGTGGGMAFPHARIDGLVGVESFFIRLDRAIPFDAIDGQSVDLIVAILSSKNDDTQHLSVMAAFSRRLRDQVVATKLRTAQSSQSVFEILNKR